MKKTFVLGATVALSVAMAAGSALAAPTLSWSGKATGHYELDSWQSPQGNGTPSNELDVSFTASDPGKWSLSTDLGNVINSWDQSNSKVTLTAPDFTLKAATGADGWELDRINPALSFVDSGDNSGGIELAKGNGKVILRKDSHLYASYNSNLGGTSVGVVGDSMIGANNNATPIASAWASQKVNGITVTGQVANKFDKANKDGNLAYGVKAGSDSLTPNIGGWVTYTSKGKNFAGTAATDNKLDGTAKYTQGPIQVNGDYWTEDNGSKTTDLNGYVIYSGSASNNGNHYSDQFDGSNYQKNVAMGAEASYETKKVDAGSPTNTLTFKATGPVIPSQLWFLASDTIQSNAGGLGDNAKTAWSGPVADIANATSTNSLSVNAYYQLNDHISVTPSFGLATATDGAAKASQTSLGADVNYKVGDNAKVTGGYHLQNTQGGAANIKQSDSKVTLGYEVDF